MPTQVIDGKVVELKFDNADFEKNVAQSMSTLDKLKQALNFDSAKSLQSITKASNNFDLSNVGSAVETVQAKFSALQVIGITALSEITKSAINLGANLVSSIINPIASGGMNRALNLEQAQFQLKGLGILWDDIKSDIDYGVKDTAYGLDAAARAASQLAASGVELGTDMKAALRGISGVASMTGSTYEDIADIFTNVAGKGKAMASEFNRIGQRGLNAKAAVAKYMNEVNSGTIEVDEHMKAMVKDISKGLTVSEADIAEWASKSKINFELFSKALDTAYGDYAKAANETYSGAMSNVKAALSRIGAEFATPYLENMRKIAVAGIDTINAIKKAMEPVFKETSKIMEMVQTRIVAFLKSDGLNDGIVPIILSIENAFYALLLILDPVKKAFKDIFPGNETLGEKFFKAAKALKEFTDKLIISEENSNKLRDTFKGLFSFIDIIKMAFSGLFRALVPYTGTLGDILSSFLDFTAGLGNSITKLRDYLKENDTFARVFSQMASIIANAGSIIKSGLDKIVQGFKDFKANHIDDKDFSGITNFIDRIKERMSAFGSVGDILSTVFGKIKDVLSGAVPVIQAGVKIVADSIGILLNGFASAFNGTGNDPITAFLNIFSTATAGTLFVSFAQALAQITKQVKTMGGLSSILYEVKNTLKTFQADLKADVLTKLAKAIAIFAASLFILSLIDPGRLLSSMVAVEVLIETLKDFVAFMEVLSKGSNLADNAKLAALSGVMIALGIAILVLASAVKKLAGLDFLSLIQGLGAVVILMKVLSEQAKLLSSNQAQIMKGAGCMIALAIAVRILASSVKVMSDIPFTSLLKGLSATVALMFSLAAVADILGQTKLSVGTGMAFIAMAASLLILAKAVEKLGALPFNQLAQGLGATVIAILAMSVALKAVGSIESGGTLVAASVALIALGAALSIFASVIVKLGALPFNQLAQGLGAAVIAILAMSVALAGLAKVANPGELLAASAAIVIMAVGLNILSSAIKTLGEMKIEDLLKGFITLAATIALFAVASTALAPILPVMAALAGVVALLGVGVLALGLGVTALSLGLASLATACTAVVANMSAILTIIATLIPAIAIALANGIIQFVVVIGNGAARIVAAVVNICHEILQGLSTLLPDMFQFVITLLIQFIDAIVVLVPYLVEAGMKLIIGLCDGISRQLPELVRAGNNLLIEFIDSMAEGIRRDTPRLIEATNNLMEAIMDAIGMWFENFVLEGATIIIKLIEGISSLWDDVKKAGSDIIDTLIGALKGGIKDIVQIGKDLVSGFIDGIKSIPGKVKEAAEGVANTALNAISETQDSNSPAVEGIKRGRDLSEGYAIGITDGREDVQHAAADVTQAALDQLGITKSAYDQARDAGRAYYREIQKEIENHQNFLAYTDKVNQIRAEQEKKNLFSVSRVKEEYAKRTRTDAKANEELRQEQFKVNKALREEKENTESATEALEKNTEATSKNAKAKKDLKDTLESQLDLFSKFEMKTEMTSETLLENMKSNIDGWASWSHRMTVIAERLGKDDIASAIYGKLEELGPKGYETMNAIYQMTDEQISLLRERWAVGMNLPQSQAEIVQSGAKYIGDMATKGFSDALNDHKAAHEAAHGLGKAALDGLSEALEVHSPSEATKRIGDNTGEGLALGLDSVHVQGLLYFAVKRISEYILDLFNENLSPEAMGQIGANIAQNIFSNMLGFENPDEFQNPLVTAFISSFENLEEFDEAVTLFVEHLVALLMELFEMEAIDSPSLLFQKFVFSWLSGIRDGLENEEELLKLKEALILFLTTVWSYIEEFDLPRAFFDMGVQCTEGMAEGMASEEALNKVREAALKVCKVATEATQSAKGLDINSPSKVMRRIFRAVPEGAVLGIMDGARNVYNAAASLAEEGIKGTEDGMGRLSDVIDSTIDLNPVITPLLDLSVVRSQMEELNAMMTAKTIGVDGQNGGTFSGEPSQQINFTQNNYSPKALSRIDIYRQTKNQISMMKGVVANA